jgi:two-component system chemotaxis response regulator CheB
VSVPENELKPSTTGPSWVIALAASADGIKAISTILGGLPADLPAAVVVIQHRSPTRTDHLQKILAKRSCMPVVSAEDRQAIEPGTVYVARPQLHLTVAPDETFAYTNGRRIQFLQSSANPLLESAASVLGGRLVAVVLTGTGSDGTDGVQSVKAHGGMVIAQDPATLKYGDMPRAAVRSGAVDRVLPLEAIAPALVEIVRGEAAAHARP